MHITGNQTNESPQDSSFKTKQFHILVNVQELESTFISLRNNQALIQGNQYDVTYNQSNKLW